MGGLITRQYCNDDLSNCLKRIRKLITMDSPHQGSELADLLVVFRDHRDLFPNPDPWYGPSCHNRVLWFTEGFTLPFVGRITSPHPLGGAIDDLASGRWIDTPFNMVPSGSWTLLTNLSWLKAHTLVGVATETAGHKDDIKALWNKVMEPCNFTLEQVFGTEANTNDRIVTRESQRAGLSDLETEQLNGVDHLSILENAEAIDRVKSLLDLKPTAPDFTAGL